MPWPQSRLPQCFTRYATAYSLQLTSSMQGNRQHTFEGVPSSAGRQPGQCMLLDNRPPL
jgi:hypothetical protein